MVKSTPIFFEITSILDNLFQKMEAERTLLIYVFLDFAFIYMSSVNHRDKLMTRVTYISPSIYRLYPLPSSHKLRQCFSVPKSIQGQKLDN